MPSFALGVKPPTPQESLAQMVAAKQKERESLGIPSIASKAPPTAQGSLAIMAQAKQKERADAGIPSLGKSSLVPSPTGDAALDSRSLAAKMMRRQAGIGQLTTMHEG